LGLDGRRTDGDGNLLGVWVGLGHAGKIDDRGFKSADRTRLRGGWARNIDAAIDKVKLRGSLLKLMELEWVGWRDLLDREGSRHRQEEWGERPQRRNVRDGGQGCDLGLVEEGISTCNRARALNLESTGNVLLVQKIHSLDGLRADHRFLSLHGDRASAGRGEVNIIL
jgi:hypothetical protein